MLSRTEDSFWKTKTVLKNQRQFWKTKTVSKNEDSFFWCSESGCKEGMKTNSPVSGSAAKSLVWVAKHNNGYQIYVKSYVVLQLPDGPGNQWIETTCQDCKSWSDPNCHQSWRRPSLKKYFVHEKMTNLLVTEIYLGQVKEGYRLVSSPKTNTTDTSLNDIILI